MKIAFALKAVAVSSALVAASSWAQSSGDFVFSNNLLGGYSLISATVGAVAPATLIVGTDDSLGTITGTPGATYSAGASAPVTSVTTNASNDIVSIVSHGGNFQNAPKSTAATGGNLIINNLSYDSATNVISADVSGANLAGTYTLATTREQVFTIKQLDFSTDGGTTWSPIADPTNFPITATNYEIRSSGLFLVGGNSGAVFSQFQQSLGLKGIGLSTLQALDTYDASTNKAGFGTLTVKVASSVPEPSSYALLGLGLAGVAFAIRRARDAR